MNIADIMDIGELERLVAEHYITRRADPTERYTLYNYTEKATFDRLWTRETRQCRGIVTDQSGRILARPFDKFFNIDESEETRLDALLARPGAVEITEKLDGSMIVVWFADGAWHTSTRGSFTSEQAQAALAWLNARNAFARMNIAQGLTLLCEWCAPDNRVVLRYDQADLILIGAREIDGLDYRYTALERIARDFGLRVTPSTADTLATLNRGAAGMEGWVARWPDGFRVKIKTEEYLRLHRLVSSFSPSRVRDVLLGIDGDWASYLMQLPEEFRAEAERMAAVIDEAARARIIALLETFTRLRPLARDSRKAYAMAVLREPADDRPYLFSLIDGKPIEQKVLAALDLDALFAA